MITLLGELANFREFVRILREQMEVAPAPLTRALAPSHSRLSLSSELSRRIEPKRLIGSTATPGISATPPATSVRMLTSKSVAISVIVSEVTSIFTF